MREIFHVHFVYYCCCCCEAFERALCSFFCCCRRFNTTSAHTALWYTRPLHLPFYAIHQGMIPPSIYIATHNSCILFWFERFLSPSLSRSLCGHICCCKMLQTTNKLQQLSQLSTIMTTWLKGGEKRTSVLKLLAH